MINEDQRKALGILAADSMVVSSKLRDMGREITAAELDDTLLESLAIMQKLCSDFYKKVDDMLDREEGQKEV